MRAEYLNMYHMPVIITEGREEEEIRREVKVMTMNKTTEMELYGALHPKMDTWHTFISTNTGCKLLEPDVVASD